ncbi:hypothetical protein KEM52_006113 [Ascosphaera acerosa]|nr:hypothetical protein KEM52_006113 [Ascosphaera acerosa]
MDKKASGDSGDAVFRDGANKADRPYWLSGIKSILFYCVVVWIPACWILGSTYKQKDHVSNLRVVVADLDQSDIGSSVYSACKSISGRSNKPTFELRSDISSFDQAYEEVYSGRYWGGVVIQPGATDRFVDAFRSGNRSYDPTAAVSVIFNSARWPATTSAYISPVLLSTITASQEDFRETRGQELLADAAAEAITPDMYAVVFSPYAAAKVDIQPFELGARYFLGTAAFVFPIILTFFISLAMRGAYEEYGYLSKTHGLLYRTAMSASLTLIGGLCYAAWLHVFHEESSLSRRTFAFVWLVLWQYGFACFWFFDIVATGIPVALIPPITLTFVVMQVTAAAFPHDVKHAFYRVEYAMPSFNAFELLVTVLTDGSTNHVPRNVAALVGWTVFWFLLDFAVHWWYVQSNLALQDDDDDWKGVFGSDTVPLSRG